jgi:hypothetical protein
MKENLVERNLMSEDEFKEYLSTPVLHTYNACNKYKSIFRAMRRCNVTKNGMLIPRRPFNNRANTSKRSGVHSRTTNELKKQIYANIMRYQ